MTGWAPCKLITCDSSGTATWRSCSPVMHSLSKSQLSSSMGGGMLVRASNTPGYCMCSSGTVKAAYAWSCSAAMTRSP